MNVFKRLHAEHTFAYETLDFDFESGIYSIVGTNGASKSSIFLTLAQGLYNRNPKGGKIDDVSNTVTGKPSIITVEWQKGADLYQVVNSRKDGITVNLWDGKKWKNVGKKRIPENLKLIEELLGVPYETFCMLTFQDVNSSLDLVEESTDTARKNFANKVLQFGELDQKLALAKELAKTVKKDIAYAEKHIDVLSNSIVSLREVRALTDTTGFETTISEGSQELVRLRIQHKEVVSALGGVVGMVYKAQEWGEVCRRKEVIEEGLSRFESPYDSLTEADQAKRSEEARLSTLKASLTEVLYARQSLVSPTPPKEPETTCSRCGSSLNAEKALEVYKADREAYEHKLAELTATTDRLSETEKKLRAQVEESNRSVAEADRECKKWRKWLEVETELINLNKKTPPEYDKAALDSKLSELKAQDTSLSDRIAEIEKSVETARKCLTEATSSNILIESVKRYNEETEENNRKLKAQITERRDEIKNLNEKLDLVNDLINILGPKGYRVHKMMGFIKSLNAAMIKYSRMLSGGKISCLFFLTEDGKIDFSVTDSDKSLPYSNWSSGEKARVKLSCLFAVLEILEIRGAASYNLLFLDEIFSALDDDGKEGLFNVLSYLRDKGKCIYTISHTPLVNSVVFDKVIRVTKSNGLATVN